MDEPAPDEPAVFAPAHARYNAPGRIVTLGAYLSTAQLLESAGALRVLERSEDEDGYRMGGAADLRRDMAWTKLIAALNQGRRWALRRLTAHLDDLLANDIAVAVVPAHDPFVMDFPVRLLAQAVASVEGKNRVDATECLVRHTKIRRIVWGGPSYRSLHRQTINVENAELVRGRNVLLLDDVARSGASLRACRELLFEAGAAHVQAVALGRVTAPGAAAQESPPHGTNR